MSSGTFHLSPSTPITKFFRDKSVKEVRENTSHITAHLTSIKRWLCSMPHLSCADDDRIFLAFLRQAKYNHSEAQMRLDNFITLRTSPESPVVNWYDRSTITIAILDEYLKMGFHCPIGFLHDGTFLFMVRIGCWNNNRVPTETVLKLLMAQLDRILEDPRVQICGLRVFIDFTGVSPSLLDTVNPKKTIRDLSKLLQEAYPFRMKGIVYYNEPQIMEVLFKLLSLWLKPKVRERFIRVKGNIKKAYEKVSGLQNVLPREYGGQNRSIKDILKEQNADFKEYFLKNEILWRGMAVNEKKRPESSKRLLSEYKEADDRSVGTTGTFIRLPVND
ncbi:putative lipid-binding protein [Schistosoma mansoni]|uniref:Putative lipid-binding protein n=1 Tax=Schistosoma mansoni TaxID=6183 RepID=G4VJL7_SCHMA|nr:putative lipid-binding protein [Schistosoma mansoni]|eukprot:XP_018652222.1 putative lipid-binding protein [Schistosoma mansoni]